MGILADYFVADDATARRYDGTWAGLPEERSPTKSVGVVELSTLWAMLDGKEWDVSTIEEFGDLSDHSQEAVTVFRFPEAFVECLAGLEGQRLENAAVWWAETEEMCWGFDAASTKSEIAVLAELSRRARRDGRHVYVWNCT